MNLSYVVLLDMWNMFGQKFLSFIRGYSVGRVPQSHLLIINRWERRCPFQCGKDYYIFKKICQGTLYEISFLQDSILFTYTNGTENSRFWILWHEAFKLHGEGIRSSQALSIALQGWAPDESFLYGPSRHVKHVWAKIPQFHRRLVGWAGAIEPPAHNKSMRP